MTKNYLITKKQIDELVNHWETEDDMTIDDDTDIELSDLARFYECCGASLLHSIELRIDVYDRAWYQAECFSNHLYVTIVFDYNVRAEIKGRKELIDFIYHHEVIADSYLKPLSKINIKKI